MESDGADIKPLIPEGDLPDKSSFTRPCAVGLKFKQSRYEDVWPEDVHAAFMEAVALYPPMGKRRLKYYRVSMRDHPSGTNHAKSFGRCQLIQSYILEKTGKNRSRKQVSSHLQRLKKIHKDNPAMCHLFSELSQPPSEHRSPQQAIAVSSQDICANISFSACHLKNDFDLTVNFQNKDRSANSSSSFSQASSSSGSSSSVFDLSTDQSPGVFSPQELSPQQLPAGTIYPSDNDYLSQLQDPLLFTDAINGVRSSSACSMSMHRLASKLPVRGRQLDSGPTAHFPCAVYFPGFQPTHQWFSYDSLMDGIPCDSPLTAAQPAFHTSLHHHPQLIPPEKRLNPGLTCDLTWPQTPNVPPGREGEPQVHYPAAMYQYNPTYPTIKVNSSGFHRSPPEGEILRLPRGIVYSCATTTPVSASDNVSNDRTIDFLGQAVSESSRNPASPSVIRPTPIYPMSYIRPDGHTPTPNSPYLIN